MPVWQSVNALDIAEVDGYTPQRSENNPSDDAPQNGSNTHFLHLFLAQIGADQKQRDNHQVFGDVFKQSSGDFHRLGASREQLREEGNHCRRRNEVRDELLQITRRNGLHLIPLVSPLTPPKRIREITEGMTGFVYYINVAGVTGVRRGLPADYPDLMRQVKKRTTLPVASGFGIADAETAKAAAQYADGVITGSGFIKALEIGTEYAADFVSKLSDGMKTH